MTAVQLQIVRADGTPAADALVAVADAPVSTTDIASVADAAGRLSIDVPVAGDYVLSICLDGNAQRVPCHLEPAAGAQQVRLPG